MAQPISSAEYTIRNMNNGVPGTVVATGRTDENGLVRLHGLTFSRFYFIQGPGLDQEYIVPGTNQVLNGIVVRSADSREIRIYWPESATIATPRNGTGVNNNDPTDPNLFLEEIRNGNGNGNGNSTWGGFTRLTVKVPHIRPGGGTGITGIGEVAIRTQVDHIIYAEGDPTFHFLFRETTTNRAYSTQITFRQSDLWRPVDIDEMLTVRIQLPAGVYRLTTRNSFRYEVEIQNPSGLITVGPDSEQTVFFRFVRWKQGYFSHTGIAINSMSIDIPPDEEPDWPETPPLYVLRRVTFWNEETHNWNNHTPQNHLMTNFVVDGNHSLLHTDHPFYTTGTVWRDCTNGEPFDVVGLPIVGRDYDLHSPRRTPPVTNEEVWLVMHFMDGLQSGRNTNNRPQNNRALPPDNPSIIVFTPDGRVQFVNPVPSDIGSNGQNLP
jgi:hypothetical protein